jgi:hypothetical protein
MIIERSQEALVDQPQMHCVLQGTYEKVISAIPLDYTVARLMEMMKMMENLQEKLAKCGEGRCGPRHQHALPAHPLLLLISARGLCRLP